MTEAHILLRTRPILDSTERHGLHPFFAIARLGVRHSPFSYGKSPGAELIQERRRVASLSFSYDTIFLVDALFGVFFLLIGNESTSFFATQPFLERFRI